MTPGADARALRHLFGTLRPGVQPPPSPLVVITTTFALLASLFSCPIAVAGCITVRTRRPSGEGRKAYHANPHTTMRYDRARLFWTGTPRISLPRSWQGRPDTTQRAADSRIAVGLPGCAHRHPAPDSPLSARRNSLSRSACRGLCPPDSPPVRSVWISTRKRHGSYPARARRAGSGIAPGPQRAGGPRCSCPSPSRWH